MYTLMYTNSLMTWQVQSDPVSHRYVVHISDTGLLAPTRARSATDLGSDGRVIPPSPTSPAGPALGADGRGSPTTGSRRSSHQYRFDCELGDVWTELTTSTSSGAALALATTHRTPRRAIATSTITATTNTVYLHHVVPCMVLLHSRYVNNSAPGSVNHLKGSGFRRSHFKVFSAIQV